ncbi:MAG: EamA family transporter [Acidimicrobiia bacterium]
MSQVFAIIAAAFYGAADFSGGLATRTISAFRVAAWSQLVGTPLLIIGVAIMDAPSVSTADLVYGALAGAFGLTGLILLYAALAQGTMSVVSPITGVLSAAIPVMWGVFGGEQLRGLQWLGVLLAISAVLFVARDHSATRVTSRVLFLSVGAAFGFALFFIAIDQTSDMAGLWPLVGARAVSTPLAFIAAVFAGGVAPPPRRILPVVLIAGLADMAANVTVLLSLQTGPLAVNAVLISLYPAFTVLAAILVLRERPTGTQRFGIGLALVAAALLAI